MGLFEDELRRAQAARAQADAQEQTNLAAQNYANRIIANNAAQAQQKKSGLVGVLQGIGESIGNVGNTMYNMFGTGGAAIRDLVTGNAGTGKYQNEWKQYMKEAQYGDANMSDKDYYAKTGGKSLDAAATVSELLPGVGVAGRAALNVGQGVASGVGKQYAANGANTTLEDALKAGAIGGASGAVGSAVSGGLGKVAAKTAPNGIVGKTINSNIGRSAITGAASGATGGALGAAMYGGDVLQGAAEGAGSGALGGATTAAVYGAVGAGLNKFRNAIENGPKSTTVQTRISADGAEAQNGSALAKGSKAEAYANAEIAAGEAAREYMQKYGVSSDSEFNDIYKKAYIEAGRSGGLSDTEINNGLNQMLNPSRPTRGDIDYVGDDAEDYVKAPKTKAEIAKASEEATIRAREAVNDFLESTGGMTSDGEINGAFEDAYIKEAQKLGLSRVDINIGLNKALRTEDVDYMYSRDKLAEMEAEILGKNAKTIDVNPEVPEKELTPGQKRRQTPMDWAENDISGEAKKRNYFQKLGKDLEQASENIRNYPVNSKLKGNLSDEVAINDTLKTLRNDYGYTPDDLDRAAILSTGVNKWYDNEIQSSGATKVNTKLADDLALPANSPLSKNYKKAYSETIQSVLDMANSGNSNIIDEYSAAGLAKADKYLTEQANKLRRTNMNGVDGRKDANLELLADAYDSARNIISGEMMDMIELDDYTRQNLAEMLKNTGAPEQAQNTILSAKNFREIKTKTAPLELARRMQRQIKSSPNKRSAAGDNSASLPTQVGNATGAGETMQAVLKPVREAAATANAILGKAATKVGNTLAGEGAAGKVVKGASNFTKAVNNGLNTGTDSWNFTQGTKGAKVFGNQTPLTVGSIANNTIARTAGINAANNVKLANEQAAAENALIEAENNYNAAQKNYDAITAQAQQAELASSEGAQQLQRISDAMSAAMAVGDFTAYGQLANLYKQAEAIYGTTTASEPKSLTATQSKALTGLQQIEALEKMTPDMGTKLVDTPLAFLVNMGGGNEYANQAQALALTLGYLQSGANITPREAENIGKSYVPTAYDSEIVRRNKLARARQLLENYLADTTALTS